MSSLTPKPSSSRSARALLRSGIFGVALVFCASSFVACGDDPPPPVISQTPTAPANTKSAAKKTKKPDSDAKSGDNSSKGSKKKERVQYERPKIDPETRRDPFVYEPPIPKKEAVEEIRVPEPAERFELSQLRLVTIITGVPVPKAMFTDPDRYGHILKEDDRIGKDGGIITAIRDNEVEVTISGTRGTSTTDEIENSGDEPAREEGKEVKIVIRLDENELTLADEAQGLDKEDQENVLKSITEESEIPKTDPNADTQPSQ